jgi:lipopolysaccharide export LptBFGC system permease protein LptF
LKILTKFLLSRFLRGVGLVILTVSGVIFAITFVERLPSNPSAINAMIDAFTRLLEYMPMFLPPAVFMGTLLAGYNLTKSSENVIVSGAGLSPYQSARPFLMGAVLIGLGAALVINPLAVKLSEQSMTADRLTLIDNAIWLRESRPDGNMTLRAANMYVSRDNLIFQDAVVMTQDADSKLTGRIESKNMTLTDAGLSTTDAKIWDTNATARTGDWTADTLLNPRTVMDRYLQPDQISFWALPKFIEKMGDIGAPVRPHWVQFWTLAFMWLTMMAMTTLGVAFSQTRQRRNFHFSFKFGIGIITCFAMYFITSMMTALGATGALPALLSVIAPQLIIIAVAGTFIAAYDNV